MAFTENEMLSKTNEGWLERKSSWEEKNGATSAAGYEKSGRDDQRRIVRLPGFLRAPADSPVLPFFGGNYYSRHSPFFLVGNCAKRQNERVVRDLSQKPTQERPSSLQSTHGYRNRKKQLHATL